MDCVIRAPLTETYRAFKSQCLMPLRPVTRKTSSRVVQIGDENGHSWLILREASRRMTRQLAIVKAVKF